MKIKGVKGGANRGDPLEYTAEEKVPLAVQEAAIKHADFAGHSVPTTKCQIVQLEYKPRNEKLRDNRPYQNNSYHCDGVAVFHLRSQKTGRLFEGKRLAFEIDFEDTVDDIGMPDIKITNFKTSPLTPVNGL